MNKDEVLKKIIYPTIKKANETMPNFFMNATDDNVVFYGKPGAILDSLNLVSFVFLLEEVIESAVGKKITITTQDVLNTDEPPFASIGNLNDFILKKLDKANQE